MGVLSVFWGTDKEYPEIEEVAESERGAASRGLLPVLRGTDKGHAELEDATVSERGASGGDHMGVLSDLQATEEGYPALMLVLSRTVASERPRKSEGYSGFATMVYIIAVILTASSHPASGKTRPSQLLGDLCAMLTEPNSFPWSSARGASA